MATEHRLGEYGSLEQLEDNLWVVHGEVPGKGFPRIMVVARLGDGRLVIHGAIAMKDSDMQQLEALGEVGTVLVPNRFHRLDAPFYRARYPQARLLAPTGARKHVDKVTATDGSYDDFPADDAISVDTLEGVGASEGVLRVRSGERVTLIFNDAIFNVERLSGVMGAVMKLAGSVGRERVTPIFKLFVTKDKKALRAHLERLAGEPGLVRVIPGHGAIIDERAPERLAAIAGEL